jgi:O-antigen ligase
MFTYLRTGEVAFHFLALEESVANPNYLAVMIAVGCVPAMVLAREMITGRKRVWGIIVASLGGLCLFSVVFLASRGVLLAVGVALIVTMLLLVRRRGFKFAVAIGVVAVLLLAGLSRLAEYQGGTLEVVRRFDAMRGETGLIGGRWELVRASLDVLSERDPVALLFGTGVYSNFIAIGKKQGNFWTHTHNIFLEYALDFGLIGAGLFLALFWVGVKSSMRAGSNVKLIKFGQLVLLAIAGLSMNPMAVMPCAIIFGLSVAYCRNDPVPPPHLNRSRPSLRAEGPARKHAAGEGGPVG